MNHTEFFSSLKNGSAERCYLFEGEEEYVKNTAITQLRKKLIGDNFPEMNDIRLNDPDAGQIIAANETLPFMAEQRMVTVFESGMLAGKTGNYDESKSVDQLKEYFSNLPETSCLVFYVRGNADKKKKLYNLMKKQAVIVSFDRLSDKELIGWIAKQFKAEDKKITQDACERLIFSSGRDLNQLNGEIGKLCAYIGDNDAVTAEEIDAICTKTTEYKVFDMAGTLLDGNGKKAFSLLNSILADGEDRLFLLALLGRQCRQMLNVTRLANAKIPTAEIVRQTGMYSFAIQKTLTQARQYTTQQLENMTHACLEMEYQVKTGTVMDEGSLEKLMLVILSYRKGRNA